MIRYVTLEGRFRVSYVYHFNLFNHFKFPVTDKLNFPFFICNCIEYSIKIFRRNIVALHLHEFLFYLVYLKYLNKKIPRFRVKVWGKLFENQWHNNPLVNKTRKTSLQIDVTTGKQYLDQGSSNGYEDNLTLVDYNLTLVDYFRIKGSHKRVREVGESNNKGKSELPLTKKV